MVIVVDKRPEASSDEEASPIIIPGGVQQPKHPNQVESKAKNAASKWKKTHSMNTKHNTNTNKGNPAAHNAKKRPAQQAGGKRSSPKPAANKKKEQKSIPQPSQTNDATNQVLVQDEKVDSLEDCANDLGIDFDETFAHYQQEGVSFCRESTAAIVSFFMINVLRSTFWKDNSPIC